MKRRVRRIYPTFLAVLLVYIVLSLASPHDSKIPPGVWHGLMYVVENVFLLPGIFPIDPIITVAWSLSYEMLYYLLIPLLVAGLGLHRWRRMNRMALFLVLSVAGILVSNVTGGPVRAVMFFGGVILFDARDRRLSLPFVAPMALIVAFASMLITTGVHRTDDAIHVALMFATLPLFCFACFSQPSSASSKVLSSWPVRWLGNMSYSYYLLHGLALKVVLMAMMHVHAPTGHESMLVAAMLIPAYLFTIAASAVLFVVIERPLSLRDSRPSLTGVALG